VASERLSELTDGHLLYELRHRWRDGTTHVAFEPLELIDRLAALVPPPRFHTVRYHGVLASRSKHRAEVVPTLRVPTPWRSSWVFCVLLVVQPGALEDRILNPVETG